MRWAALWKASYLPSDGKQSLDGYLILYYLTIRQWNLGDAAVICDYLIYMQFLENRQNIQASG